MSKQLLSVPAVATCAGMLFCGIDVSAKTLDVAVQRSERAGLAERQFANTAAGHRQLLVWLGRQSPAARVTLEATGIYSLDLALRLDQAEGIEVAVLNPKTAVAFTRSLARSKTDRTDARALSEYSLRMRFEAWKRPETAVLELRALGRHMATLTKEHTRLANRLHAARGSAVTPRCVRDDLRRSLAGVEKRLLRLRRLARARIEQEAELKRKYLRLIEIPGIGELSAVQILSELAALDPAMTARQWVAHSGLDPAHHQSGTSVQKQSHISRQGNRHLRRGLFMPALTAARCDHSMKAFYLELLARQKSKMQALVACARKLLHAIFGIFKTDTPYDGAKLFPARTSA